MNYFLIAYFSIFLYSVSLITFIVKELHFMFKHYLVAIIISLVSWSALADESTYKDQIPVIMEQIGTHKDLSIIAFKANKKDEEYLPSESKSSEALQLNTDVGDLSSFVYYLRSDGNVMVRLSYANEKVYKATIFIEALNYKTSYRYPSYLVSIERQSDFYKHDLADYLLDHGWNYEGLFEHQYSKENYILKISHSEDYALIVEISDKNLITELKTMKRNSDSYTEGDDYVKEVYRSLVTTPVKSE